MPPRHLPALWLMTDERMGDLLWPALHALPRGAGVIVRHYRTTDRRALFERVRTIARARRLVLVLAGPPRLAIAWRADGAHGAHRHVRASRRLVRTVPCHDRVALIAAHGADLRFVSPVFATRSHAGAAALGRVRLGLMIAGDRDQLVALGGMTARRARGLRPLGIDRWAAIDALTDQKRKAVPT
jgi:thiamine-phosphate pyrophosphorylase